MTSDHYYHLVQIANGLFGTLDAMQALADDQESCESLHYAALALSRSLKGLVDEIAKQRPEGSA